MGILKLIGSVFLLCVGSVLFLNGIQYLADKQDD